MINATSLSAFWSQWALVSTLESLVLLLIVAAIWFLVRRQVAPQVGVWLFLLVPVKLLFPFSLPAPNELANLSPANVVERTIFDSEQLSATLAGGEYSNEILGVEAEKTARNEAPSIKEGASITSFTSSTRQASPESVSSPRVSLRPEQLPFSFWLFSLWICVATFLLVRFLLSQFAFRSRIKSAQPIQLNSLPFDFESLSTQVGAGKVLLLESNQISSPIVCGLRQPKIILPTNFGGSISADQFKWAILHELAHVKRFDLWFVLIQRLVAIVNWFNPAIWISNVWIDRLREFACDDIASVVSDSDPVEAGQAFVEVLRFAADKQMEPANVLGLFGWNGSSTSPEIKQRLQRMLDETRNIRIAAGKWSVIGLLLLAVVFIPKLQASGKPPLAETAVGQEDETISDTGRFELLIVDSEDQPVSNAQIEIRTKVDFEDGELVKSGKLIKQTRSRAQFQTDDKGLLVIEGMKSLEDSTKKLDWNIFVRTSGYAPYYSPWSNNNESSSVPSKQKIQLGSAWTVGGVVENEQGEPVVGAEVDVSVKYQTPPTRERELYFGRSPTTDENGHWKFEMVPNHLADVGVAVTHPDYKPARIPLSRSGFEILADVPLGKIKLDPGLVVTGTITDELGNFVEGALVRTKFLNNKKQATTAMDGTYRISGCEKRKVRIVVSAPGKALELKEVFVEDEMKPVDFQMKPGGKVRMKVVDPAGKPLAGAGFHLQKWRTDRRVGYFEFDHVKCKTNDEGIWEWDEAPLDSFVGDIYSRGHGEFMTLSGQTITVTGELQVFKLAPQLYVSGKVTDAETGEPIKKFRVIPGLEETNRNLSSDDGFEAKDGKYRLKHFRQSYAALFVRIEADGYKPVESRDIKSDEGEVVVDFKLERARNIVATILTPDGKPAEGATVTVGVGASQINLKNGRLDKSSTYESPTRETDDKGEFKITPREKGYHLVILHESGFAHVITRNEKQISNFDDSKNNATLVDELPGKIELTPWGRIEGTLKSGAQTLANKKLTLLASGIHSHGNGVPNIFTHNDVVSGKGGKFVFERVVPGRNWVTRKFTLMVNDGALEVGSTPEQLVIVKPDQTASLQLGGSGRAIKGKLLPGIASDGKPRWSFATISIQRQFEFPKATPPPAVKEDPKKRRAWFKEWKKSPAGLEYDRLKKLQMASTRFFATVSSDGTFRVDDMPKGKYTMSIRFDQHSAGVLPDYRFEIEDDTLGNPLDLEEIQLLPSLR